MLATVLSLIIAIFIYLGHLSIQEMPNATIIGIALIFVATLFLFLPTLLVALAWSSLQQSEQNLTPKIFSLFRSDNPLTLARNILILFSLVSYLFAFDILFTKFADPGILLPLWIIALGIAIDSLHHFLSRVSKFLDPFHAVELFSEKASTCIRNQNELDYCDWIDALSEVALRAIHRTSISLCSSSINSIQLAERQFLGASKSISHDFYESNKQANFDKKEEGKYLGLTDKVSYSLFFVLQRLEMINDQAVAKKLEPICSNLITAVGKMVIDAAKCDISLPSYPLQFLGRFAVNAQKNGLSEVGSKAICVLIEIANRILTDIDVTYAELQPPFFTLISQIDEINKEIFRQDKTINIKFLTQPLLDVKALFNTEKMSTHQDTPAIVGEINRVLAELSALELTMKTIPPINFNNT